MALVGEICRAMDKGHFKDQVQVGKSAGPSPTIESLEGLLCRGRGQDWKSRAGGCRGLGCENGAASGLDMWVQKAPSSPVPGLNSFHS